MIAILVSGSGGTSIRASVAALAAVFLSAGLAEQRQLTAPATESRVAVDHTALYVRVAGRGQPMIVLHGGPDFDPPISCRSSIGSLMRIVPSTMTSVDAGNRRSASVRRT
jgi:hypothetical protein